tara:strand:- start:5159 stop:5509 length:351 start_codon:yes stop_codon:yes gene_type:complete
MTTKQQLHEDQIIGVEIDLEELKKNDQLNESFLRMFGSWVTLLLKGMFGIPLINMNIKGSPGDVRAFAAAIGNEKKYIEVAKQHGLDNPATYQQQTKLQSAVSAFEKATGLKWPFK